VSHSRPIWALDPCVGPPLSHAPHRGPGTASVSWATSSEPDDVAAALLTVCGVYIMMNMDQRRHMLGLQYFRCHAHSLLGPSKPMHDVPYPHAWILQRYCCCVSMTLIGDKCMAHVFLVPGCEITSITSTCTMLELTAPTLLSLCCVSRGGNDL